MWPCSASSWSDHPCDFFCVDLRRTGKPETLGCLQYKKMLVSQLSVCMRMINFAWYPGQVTHISHTKTCSTVGLLFYPGWNLGICLTNNFKTKRLTSNSASYKHNWFNLQCQVTQQARKLGPHKQVMYVVQTCQPAQYKNLEILWRLLPSISFHW